MSLHEVFDRRIRGFRAIEVVAAGLLATTILSVYLAKAFATGQRSEIARIEDQIATERSQMRALKAEVAYLEQPERLKRLARSLDMAPTSAGKELTSQQLATISLTGAVQ